MNPEEFVDVWMDAVKFGKTQGWIAQQMNVHHATVDRWARKLRRQGVELPPLKYAQQKFDVNRLNEIVKERGG